MSMRRKEKGESSWVQTDLREALLLRLKASKHSDLLSEKERDWRKERRQITAPGIWGDTGQRQDLEEEWSECVGLMTVKGSKLLPMILSSHEGSCEGTC